MHSRFVLLSYVCVGVICLIPTEFLEILRKKLILKGYCKSTDPGGKDFLGLYIY